MILLNKGAADAAVHLITDNSCRMNKVIVINAISGYVLWSDSSVRLDEAHSSLYIHEIHLKFEPQETRARGLVSESLLYGVITWR